MTIFNFAFLFWEELNYSFKYFKLLKKSNSWFEKPKFRDENETCSYVCVRACVCACLCVCVGGQVGVSVCEIAGVVLGKY